MTKLFGTSGIRGVVGLDVTAHLAMKVGLALASSTGAKTILTAQDPRTTSDTLQFALAAGITACGATVLRQGLIPTPALAYLTKETGAGAGVMITASHNPPEYNGMKLYNPDTTAYNSSQQNQIETAVAGEQFKLASWRDIGTVAEIDESHKYVQMVTRGVNLKRDWKIVLDPGNGATCQLAPRILRNLGCRVIAINAQPDGHFPGRGAEPNEKTLISLCNIVLELEADLGIAFDGDGDRIVVANEKGTVSPPDQTLAAYASEAISQQRRKTIVTSVEASMCVEKLVEAEGGRVVRTKVGDVSIAEDAKKHGAAFGGEPCGAWIHPAQHYCPDGILSSIKLLQALEATQLSLSAFASRAPHYPLLRQNLAVSNQFKAILVEKAHNTLRTIFPNVKEESTVDGLRLTLDNGWILVRASGTEPYVRITVEAETKGIASELMKKARSRLSELARELNA